MIYKINFIINLYLILLIDVTVLMTNEPLQLNKDYNLLDTRGSRSGIQRKEAIKEARGIDDEATRTASL